MHIIYRCINVYSKIKTTRCLCDSVYIKCSILILANRDGYY